MVAYVVQVGRFLKVKFAVYWRLSANGCFQNIDPGEKVLGEEFFYEY